MLQNYLENLHHSHKGKSVNVVIYFKSCVKKDCSYFPNFAPNEKWINRENENTYWKNFKNPKKGT